MNTNNPICPRCKRYLIGHADRDTQTLVYTCKVCKYVITERIGEPPNDSKYVLATGRPGAK